MRESSIGQTAVRPTYPLSFRRHRKLLLPEQALTLVAVRVARKTSTVRPRGLARRLLHVLHPLVRYTLFLVVALLLFGWSLEREEICEEWTVSESENNNDPNNSMTAIHLLVRE